MPTLIALLIITVISSFLICFILVKLIKIHESEKFLLFGIEISLLGIFFGISPNINLNGYELCIILTGFVVTLFGLKSNRK